MGYSFGGYYAPRIAAFERRYAACVCLGALHWDLHAWQKKIKEQLAADPKKSAQSNFQFQWILGLTTPDAALERAKAFLARRRRRENRLPGADHARRRTIASCRCRRRTISTPP